MPSSMERIRRAGQSRERPYMRDRLAAYRTVLANERTFLAYVRTALAFCVVGVSFVKFFDNDIIEFIGWVLIPAGVLTFIKGSISFRRTSGRIKQEEKRQHIADDSETPEK
jgi:putative membrane protein